jgi:hypothetical protein
MTSTTAIRASGGSRGIQSGENTHHQDQSVTWASLRARKAKKTGSARVFTMRGGKPFS